GRQEQPALQGEGLLSGTTRRSVARRALGEGRGTTNRRLLAPPPRPARRAVGRTSPPATARSQRRGHGPPYSAPDGMARSSSPASPSAHLGRSLRLRSWRPPAPAERGSTAGSPPASISWRSPAGSPP